MSAFNEKADNTSNGLTITRPAASRRTSGQSVEVLSTIEDIDSTHSLSPTHTPHNEKSDERASPPLSPFYSPNPTRYSHDGQKSESKQNISNISTPYDTDVEACSTPQKGSSRLLQTRSRQDMDCTVWPGQNEMRKKKKEMRRQRGKNGVCGCLARFDKKTKIWIKIVIALLVIGAAVGVGVGISRAVGGGVWKSKSASNAPIEGSHNG